MKEQVNFQEQTKGTQSVLRFTNRQCCGDCTAGRAVVREQPQLKACSHAPVRCVYWAAQVSAGYRDLVGTRPA